MTQPSGAQHEISAGGYSAVVTQVGGGLRVLRHGNRDLVVPWGSDEVRPVYRGALLAPWPNRVRDGRWLLDGEEQQLPITEPERGTAIHGLAAWAPWEPVPTSGPVSADADAVELATRLWPRTGYPFVLDLRVRYFLDADGLVTRLTARNAGRGTAPYGCAPHPYLVAGAGRVDDWTVEVPASRTLRVDDERLLPSDPPVVVEVGEAGLDLRRPTSLSGLELDTAFTGLDAGRVAVRTGDGDGVEISWDPAVLPWVQVHTGDLPDPTRSRVGLAVEPMTCPPDAFSSGVDLVWLEPGAEHVAQWRIRSLA